MYAVLAISNKADFIATALAIDPVRREPQRDTSIMGNQFATMNCIQPEHRMGFLHEVEAALVATQALTVDVSDFVMHMCWHYQRMSQEARVARTKVIEGTFEICLGDSWKDELKNIGRLDYYEKALCIVPDALLEDEVRFLCQQALPPVLKGDLPGNPLRTTGLVEHHKGLLSFQEALLQATDLPMGIRSILVDTAYSRPLLKLGAFNETVERLLTIDTVLTTKLRAGFFTLVGKELAKDVSLSSFCVARRCDAFEQAAKEFLANLPSPAEFVAIKTLFYRARETFRAQMDVVKLATVDALRAGIPMGAANAEIGARLLAAIASTHATLDAQAQPRYMEARKQEGGKKAPANIGDRDADARAAWSIAKWAEWIDGPIGAKAKALDRKAIAARLHGDSNTKASPTIGESPQQTQSTPGSQLASRVSQVDQVIQDALKKSAEYFLADGKDMLARARLMPAAADEERKPLEEHSEELAKCCAELDALCAAKTKVDEEKARTLFMNTEAACDAVRRSVVSVMAATAARQLHHELQLASQRFRQSFGAALMTALKAENVAFGRRDGGVVACEAQDEDWAFVMDNFHNCWVPDLTVFAPDSVSRLELGTNQVAALYVTGSSNSGAAFDVTVHLWRRRSGNHAPPGLIGERLLPPMDREHWYDTFVTCCVLHVPKRNTTTTSTTTTSTAGRGRGGKVVRGRGSRK